jgi:hypothetical protein
VQGTAGFPLRWPPESPPESSGSDGGEGNLFDDEGSNEAGFCVGGRTPGSSSFANDSEFRIDAPIMLPILIQALLVYNLLFMVVLHITGALKHRFFDMGNELDVMKRMFGK